MFNQIILGIWATPNHEATRPALFQPSPSEILFFLIYFFVNLEPLFILSPNGFNSFRV